eukprot:CAMPEP_0197601790 /NCGR_PEP_ID=MMETSP1326-20131121/35963_1 /TAXON_ID=1155430 /ORGANISM="Genus nov. species nov., Strain RCC2288" /LENGTH=253 /DNA_ID=CAMNT_0043169055 /DNA_START=1 /DNA_END=762 /DNA_ORIENTATION=+
MPSDRAVEVRRTTEANPKPRDAVRRVVPKYVVGRRNPVTAEWAIAADKVGVTDRREVFVPSTMGGGSLPLPCPPVLGAKDSLGMWRVKPALGFTEHHKLSSLSATSRGRLSDAVQWKPLPADVSRMYRHEYGEFAPETKRVAGYKDAAEAEKGLLNPVTGTWSQLPNDPSRAELTYNKTVMTGRRNESHFEASTWSTPDKFSDREEKVMTQGRGIRRYLTTKNEGHFTTGFTPSRAMPPAPALFGITGNGVWA